MSINQLKPLLFVTLMLLILPSCTKDEGLPASSESTLAENYKGEKGGHPKPHGDGVPLKNEILIDWIDLYLELDRYATGMRPNASARAIAYINLAAYETVARGLHEFDSNRNRIPGFDLEPSDHLPKIDWSVALNVCYAEVMTHFLLNVGSLKQKIDVLRSTRESQVSQNLTKRVIDDSKAWGLSIARQVIEYSKTDLEAEEQIFDPQPTSYEPPVSPGFWTFSAEPERALYPYWQHVRTFLISPGETTSRSPLAYSETPGSSYYQEMLEVYESNNAAKEQDDESLWIAEFWSDDVEGLMFSPPARQLSIAKQLIQKYDLSLGEALYLNLKLGFALNDAAVSTWKYKYQYMVMRPSVYIQNLIDAAYQTNLYRLIYWPNPTFPAYPSGHSCFASAAAGVFIDFFGVETNFTDRSHEGRTEFRGQPRTFKRFDQMAEESGYSRIPLGVHMRMDCEEGLRLGYEISDAINRYNLKRPKTL